MFGWPSAVLWALACALPVQAAEVGASVCAVFGAGTSARVRCGVVQKTTSAVTEVAWTDCPTCGSPARTDQLLPTKAAAEKALAAARKTTLVMSELARGGPSAGFATWVETVVARPPDTRPEARPRRCSADLDGDGAPEVVEIATGPLPQLDTMLLTRGTAHHVLFRGELAGGYDRSKLTVKCLSNGVFLCFYGMDCFSAWEWNGKSYVEVNLWDENTP